MKSYIKAAFILLATILFNSCSANGFVAYQPPVLPIIITIDTTGSISVTWEGSVQTPMGTFSVGTSTKLSDFYPDKNGVLVVNVDSTNTVYDLNGASDISIHLDSGYYKQIELRKEGKNWYFAAERIPSDLSSDQITVSLTNQHCEDVDFYVDEQIVVAAIEPNSNRSFSIGTGNHKLYACVAGTNDCGSSEVNWTTSTSHRILPGSQCSNTEPTTNSETRVCNKSLVTSTITPFRPTVKPRTKFTVTIHFYNPNDCDLYNVKYTLGWQNDLAGQSSFTISSIKGHGTADISLSLTAPSNEGAGYFTMYNSNLDICEGYCEPTFVYANVEK